MELTLDSLKKEEVLRYLGYRGAELLPHTERLIEGCIQETLRLVRPAYRYQKFLLREAEEGVFLEGTGICLKGEDIRRHLAGCKEGYLLCATVGSYLDKKIRLDMVTDPAAGVILDSCGSVAVEQVVEAAEQEIEREAEASGKHITWRFSPGYGDLPLDVQRGLAEVLDTYRRLGVGVCEDMLLSPSKSVTAIIGVLEPEVGLREEGV